MCSNEYRLQIVVEVMLYSQSAGNVWVVFYQILDFSAVRRLYYN